MSGSWASAPPAGGRHERTFPRWPPSTAWSSRGLTASSAASAQAASDAFGVPAYQSVSELAQAVDLVLVAVKVPRHRELILPALELGVPVLSEWPLGLDLHEAEELERAARGTPTFVGLQGRSAPVFRWLADLVADGSRRRGAVGDRLGVDGGLGPTGVRAHALHARSRNGATMLTIAFGHAIDTVTKVVGELEEVVATTATRRPQVALAGTAGHRRDDRRGPDRGVRDRAGRGGPVRPLRGGTRSGFSLTIDGTEGTLEVTAASHPHLAPVTVRAGVAGELTLPDGYDAFPHLAGTPAHSVAHAYAAIRDDLAQGTTSAPDFAHAVKRHRLLDAIQRSAATGQRVRP